MFKSIYSNLCEKGNGDLCACLTCFLPLGLCCIRSNARAVKNIDGSMLEDCCAVLCCGKLLFKNE